MLHNCVAKSLDDIWFEDIPYIIHPDTAVRDLGDTARENRIFQEWNLPQGYNRFVSRYHQFHWQRPGWRIGTLWTISGPERSFC